MCLHPVLPVAWASLSSTALCIPSSLELVLWYCNNYYSNSVLFEVRNVVTSLLGLVIVSHLSPKGSGVLQVVSEPIGLAVDHNPDLKSCLNMKTPLTPKKKLLSFPRY
jgi:hypothetical protein